MAPTPPAVPTAEPTPPVRPRTHLICGVAGAAAGLLLGGVGGAIFIAIRNATFGASNPMGVGGFAVGMAVVLAVLGFAACAYASKVLPAGETVAGGAGKAAAGAAGLGMALGGLIGVQFGALGCVLGTLGGGVALAVAGAPFGALTAAVRSRITA
jgi:hypothetical protein